MSNEKARPLVGFFYIWGLMFLYGKPPKGYTEVAIF
jgi:hypothetical protein